ncbi:MSMEG_0570 family nitrogen starvation response protein [Dermacoccus nishinomiyaensis]|uniref:MSMEG_0570 family nitrogen starvation response protein n=1 Tax=Dermacoccus nishinomiyaensis TaxID=1274 RepID=UPI001EF6B8E9|nr:MSMEG_0570 family nitrogen starvation response protein [Dermacoccus nishinomiyaensis]MCG7429968.1 MSMEG_0570 family nitrogen starvation response protein [Dermacoccus nishinomiyaensis]
MPEMRFAVRWPDGAETSHYSPSLVMHDYLVTGLRYPLQEFVSRTKEALDVASDRVREKYGFACTSAMASQEKIAANAAAYTDGDVTVLSMEPPLPGDTA